MNTILAVILTLIVVGGATGAAMYNVLDRGNTGEATNDGAVVEPIFGSPSPSPEPETQEPQPRVHQERPTEEPTTIIVVPRHTASPTPFEHRTDEPHETAEQDEDFHTEEPTDGEFDESPE